jgi:hypothetical protein
MTIKKLSTKTGKDKKGEKNFARFRGFQGRERSVSTRLRHLAFTIDHLSE